MVAQIVREGQRVSKEIGSNNPAPVLGACWKTLRDVILKPDVVWRAEESPFVFSAGNEKQILRFAQNDAIK